MQVTVGAATVRVRVPEVALLPPLGEAVAENVRGYVPASAAVGVPVILQVRMYCSVVPEPDVDWAHPAPDANVRSPETGRAPEAIVMDDG